MNLDDIPRFNKLDARDMLGEIDRLPDQLMAAWRLGKALPLPVMEKPQRVVLAGLGGSAIGADLFVSYSLSFAPIPIFVHRDYGLPSWARGSRTLVVCSSHSGNTEETLDSFESGLNEGNSLVAICTGGKLAKRASENDVPLWTFDHKGQPRAAVGYSFGLLLALFAGLNLIPDPSREVEEAVSAMKELQKEIRSEIPAARNPAKRYAGQLVGRWVTVIGSGILAPVARRWKGQVNELAKAGANFDVLPEADHNTLAGTVNPHDLLNSNATTLFLRSPSDHPRNRLRAELTKQVFTLEGLNADAVEARGESSLAHIWTLLLFGDYMAYYLAMAYGMDPTPVDALENFKREMRKT